jgi:hypothetical protein
MEPEPDRGAIAFAEKLLTMLAEGRFAATYKYAVLLGLMDLCLEHSTRKGAAPQSVTTRQLAEKVLELYWPHTVPFGDLSKPVLRQNAGRQAGVLSEIDRFRSKHALDSSAALVKARSQSPEAYDRLIRAVEWKLVEMPLPRLQLIGKERDPFLYEIRWDEDIKRGEFNDPELFDNLIRFVGAAGDHLIRLSGLLRPLVQREWASFVSRLNPRGRSSCSGRIACRLPRFAIPCASWLGAAASTAMNASGGTSRSITSSHGPAIRTTGSTTSWSRTGAATAPSAITSPHQITSSGGSSGRFRLDRISPRSPKTPNGTDTRTAAWASRARSTFAYRAMHGSGS